MCKIQAAFFTATVFIYKVAPPHTHKIKVDSLLESV